MVDHPGVCKHFGLDHKKICGPYLMAMGNREANCCFEHGPDSPLHWIPKVQGKPFHLTDHKAELEAKGLSVFRQELKDEGAAGKKPPGKPKDMNGVPVYPARHFA